MVAAYCKVQPLTGYVLTMHKDKQAWVEVSFGSVTDLGFDKHAGVPYVDFR